MNNTRVVHISDLHFPSRDEGVAQVLEESIAQKRPDFLIVTGDLVNHPSMWWIFKKGAWLAAYRWLGNIQKQMGKDLTILVLPGNHDVLVSGLTGWCWPATKAFAHVFGTWYRPGVYHSATTGLTFLTLDTNPWGASFSAQGKALGSRLGRLKRDMDRHPETAQIRSSTKILLMHHHPLPVPFQGGDWLLDTRRVDRLLRFVAENHIDLVLHGHKHNATWSHLRVGGTSVDPFFIEVIGAGAAMKQSDYDPRGHNLNVIDVATNGVRHVRQFFKRPAESYFAEVPPSKAEEGVSRLIQAQFRQPYRAKQLTWSVETDEEGDAKNRLNYSGVVFNRHLDVYELPLPEDDLEIGRVFPYRLLSSSPQQLGAKLVARHVDRRERTFVVFTHQPNDQASAEIEVENYDLDAYAMDRREAEQRALKDTKRDFVELLLIDPVEELRFKVKFPASFHFSDVRLEVLEPIKSPDVIHQDLTRKLSVQVKAIHTNEICANLSLPPPNFRYKLSWEIPPSPCQPLGAGVARARSSVFERFYLDSSRSTAPPSEQEAGKKAIVHAFECLWSTLEGLISEALLAQIDPEVLKTMDLSMMVCDHYSAPAPPKLRLVFWSRERDAPQYFKEFNLAIGEGNAGRAYKSRTLRLFDEEKAKDNPKANTYREWTGGPKHIFLLSIPLLDPVSHFPIAVLNLGTSSPRHAELLRALTLENLEGLARIMHQEPLTRLLRAAKLEAVL